MNCLDGVVERDARPPNKISKLRNCKISTKSMRLSDFILTFVIVSLMPSLLLLKQSVGMRLGVGIPVAAPSCRADART